MFDKFLYKITVQGIGVVYVQKVRGMMQKDLGYQGFIVRGT